MDDRHDAISSKDTLDMTRGPIARQLVRFALPLLLGTLVQMLYSTVDLIFAGNFIGTQAAAAIGASTLLVTCLVGFFGGLAAGSNVVAAHAFGAHDRQHLSDIVHSTAALGIFGGIALMVIGWLIAPWFLTVIDTPAEALADGITYLRVYFISMPAIVIYDLGSGILRALGDSRRPLLAQLAGGLANVAMNAFFVIVLQLGVAGTALSTFVAQTVAAAYVVWRLTRLDSAYALRRRKIRLRWDVLRPVLAIGVPAGLQALVITLSNVVAQYFINSLGTDATAAFAAFFKIDNLIYLPAVAMGQAVMTFVGQNVGAGDPDRAHKATMWGLAISIAINVATVVVALASSWWLFRAFTTSPQVIELGCRLVRVIFPFYFFYCILQVLGDSLRGAGHSTVTMLIVTIDLCVVRALLMTLIVPAHRTIEGVGVAYPITFALTAACMTAYYVWTRRHAKVRAAVPSHDLEASAQQ